MRKQAVNHGYAKLAGRIKTVAETSATVEEALQNGFKCIAAETPMNYALIWQSEPDGTTIHPSYWIGNRDFTGCIRETGVGAVGQAVKTNESILFLQYRNGDDRQTEQALDGLQISSMFCVPFSANGITGCFQLIRTDGTFFDPELSDLCRLLTASVSAVAASEPACNTWCFREPLLSLRGVKKSFPNGDAITLVLKGIHLDVFKGEFLVLIGESGSGKTTLLNILGGMLIPESGCYQYLGYELQNASSGALTRFRKDHVGFVFQNYNLMPNLTAIQNVDFIGELVEHPKDSFELLRQVGMADKKDDYPAQLSGGQQQRVSIARALVKRPELVLADEPTAALDYNTATEVLELFSDISKDGTTLIMVTHNNEITKMADRVVRIRDGNVCEVTINRRPFCASALTW